MPGQIWFDILFRLVTLLADGVSNCFLAGFADFFFMLGEAGKNLAVTHFDIAAMGLDVGLAFLGEVVDRY
jgi:hypothetical protein